MYNKKIISSLLLILSFHIFGMEKSRVVCSLTSSMLPIEVYKRYASGIGSTCPQLKNNFFGVSISESLSKAQRALPKVQAIELKPLAVMRMHAKIGKCLQSDLGTIHFPAKISALRLDLIKVHENSIKLALEYPKNYAHLNRGEQGHILQRFKNEINRLDTKIKEYPIACNKAQRACLDAIRPQVKSLKCEEFIKILDDWAKTEAQLNKTTKQYKKLRDLFLHVHGQENSQKNDIHIDELLEYFKHIKKLKEQNNNVQITLKNKIFAVPQSEILQNIQEDIKMLLEVSQDPKEMCLEPSQYCDREKIVRARALACKKTLEDSTFITEQYIVSPEFKKELVKHAVNPDYFTVFTGSIAQQNVHKECIEIGNDICLLHSGPEFEAFKDLTLDLVLTASCYNQLGKQIESTRFLDACWIARDYAYKIAEGTKIGTDKVINTLKHPVISIKEMALGPMYLGAFLADIIAESIAVTGAEAFSIADLGSIKHIPGLSDILVELQQRAKEKSAYLYTDLKEKIDKVYQPMTQYLQETSGPDIARDITSNVVEIAITRKCKKGLLKYLGKISDINGMNWPIAKSAVERFKEANKVAKRAKKKIVSKIQKGADGLVKPLGRGSTGRTIAKNLEEQLAMQEVMSNPNPYLNGGSILPVKMSDTKNGWLTKDGWVKVQKVVKNVNLKEDNIKIHYVWNKILNVFDDFKFKD